MMFKLIVVLVVLVAINATGESGDCKGPITSDWDLSNVEYNLTTANVTLYKKIFENSTLTARKAGEQNGTMWWDFSEDGSSQFGMSGYFRETANFKGISGAQVEAITRFNSTIPVLVNKEMAMNNSDVHEFMFGANNVHYKRYSGRWNCDAEPNTTVTCTTYTVIHHAIVPYVQTWTNPAITGCSLESTGTVTLHQYEELQFQKNVKQLHMNNSLVH